VSALRCLVFGGSGALGGSVCAALAEHGARVALTYHRGEAMARALAARMPDAIALPLDVTSIEAIETAVDAATSAMGGLDAFVQCAGVGVTTQRGASEDRRRHVRMEAVDESAWDQMMAVNAKSTFFAVRRVAATMARGGGGNVVLVGSIDGVKPVPSPVHYAASKGALAGMTTAMAKELGESRVRVNMVAPGILEAGLSRDIPPELLQEYVKHCGLKRLGRVGEVASLIAWLALHNTYVTGQVVLVDGAL
jgi:NAD(P)-dependent dehydrogenase (short-subunit alcohol dehydrogenase family)